MQCSFLAWVHTLANIAAKILFIVNIILSIQRIFRNLQKMYIKLYKKQVRSIYFGCIWDEVYNNFFFLEILLFLFKETFNGMVYTYTYTGYYRNINYLDLILHH